MHIVVGVTRYARAVSVVKRGCLMTAVACHQGVAANQWKVRYIVIEPQFCGPACRQVAAGAPTTELAHVHVIRGVAVGTIARQRIVEILRMAARAGELTMTVRQRKTGFGQMIEQHGIPVEIVVAASAVGAKATCVRIVTRVAAVASAPGKIRKILSAMTRPAVKTLVSADQRKPGDSHVIEADIDPAVGAVAIGALCAVATFVHVIVAVTVVARSSDLRQIVTQVATTATHGSMCTVQGKTRNAVIEVGVAPRVGVVTRAAVVA